MQSLRMRWERLDGLTAGAALHAQTNGNGEIFLITHDTAHKKRVIE